MIESNQIEPHVPALIAFISIVAEWRQSQKERKFIIKLCKQIVRSTFSAFLSSHYVCRRLASESGASDLWTHHENVNEKFKMIFFSFRMQSVVIFGRALQTQGPNHCNSFIFFFNSRAQTKSDTKASLNQLRK